MISDRQAPLPRRFQSSLFSPCFVDPSQPSLIVLKLRPDLGLDRPALIVPTAPCRPTGECHCLLAAPPPAPPLILDPRPIDLAAVFARSILVNARHSAHTIRFYPSSVPHFGPKVKEYFPYRFRITLQYLMNISAPCQTLPRNPRQEPTRARRVNSIAVVHHQHPFGGLKWPDLAPHLRRAGPSRNQFDGTAFVSSQPTSPTALGLSRHL